MFARFEEFKEKYWAAAPPPLIYNETEEYSRFINVFTPTAFGIAVALAYATTLLFTPILQDASIWLADVFPLFKGRLDFLEVYDEYSKPAYTATVLSGFCLMPIMLGVNAIGYWKTVVSPRRCKRVKPLTLLTMAGVLLIPWGFFWIAFVDVPESYDPRYPGMARILFWPIFPALGAVGIVGCMFGVFGVVIGLMKFAFILGGYNGRFES